VGLKSVIRRVQLRDPYLPVVLSLAPISGNEESDEESDEDKMMTIPAHLYESS
jgi:hypothetical protein